MEEDTVYMWIPVSEGCASVRGIASHNGYAQVPVQIDKLSGKLAKMIATGVSDVRTDQVLILSRKSMFQKIKENDLSYLGVLDTIEDYADRIESALEGLDRLLENTPKHIIYGHDSRPFQWSVWDNPLISSEIWLNEECRRIRSEGLVIDIAGKKLPASILRSMGAKLLGVARKQGLVEAE
jgi:hypothetical protein